MKWLYPAVLLLLASCAPPPTQAPILPTDIPPTEIFNQFPTPLPTPTLAVLTRPIGEEERDEAFNFLYEQKNNLALGEFEHFAEEIRYPITVMIDGQPKTFVYVAEFEANIEKIFLEEDLRQLIAVDESELSFTSNGVKVADGLLWFDLICMDPECEDAEFLITHINN